MLIELLSTSNYVSFNIKLAELLGLHSAIYLSELMNINDKAIRKSKLKDNYFSLKREYITSRTTLSEKEQIDIEKNLLKLGILEKGEAENDMSVNITTLTTLLMTADEKLIDDVKKLTKSKTKKATKDEKMKENLKSNIVTQNEELRRAYFDWIDTVYDKQGWLSKVAVVTAQNIIDEYSKRNLDIALKLIEIASVNGYRDMTWAVNNYEKEHRASYRIVPTSHIVTTRNTNLSDEVF